MMELARRRSGAVEGWPLSLGRSSPLLRWLFVLVFADGMLNALYVRPLVVWPVLSWSVDVLTHVVLPFTLLGLAVARHQVRWRDLGFRASTNDEYGRVVLAVLLICVPVVSVLVYALAVEMGRIIAPDSGVIIKMPSPGVMPAAEPWRLLAIVYLGVSAGLVAEVVYRGVLLQLMPPGVASSWGYLVLSPLLCGLTYWESGLSLVITMILFGLFMAGLYRATGTIWPVIVGHVAVDLLWIAVIVEQL